MTPATATGSGSAFPPYTSVFERWEEDDYPHRFAVELTIGCLAGGVPKDERVAEGWIKAKMQSTDDRLRAQVAETMLATMGENPDVDAAIDEVIEQRGLVGFKRDEGGLYIEGRQAKAAIKEACNVAVGAGKLKAKGWGETRKGALKYLSEHVFVLEDRLPLGINEPSGVEQRFVHTFRGSSISYIEYARDVKVAFTVISDHNYSDREWATIWLTGERQGIGASRSQGFGTYKVTKWERLT